MTRVEDSGLLLALVLEASNQLVVTPAHLGREVAEAGELAAGVGAEDLQRGRDDGALGLVVRRGDALKHLQALHGGGTAARLVREHTADHTPHHARRRAVVDGTTLRVGVGALAQKLKKLHC